jgi:hypothetical protein
MAAYLYGITRAGAKANGRGVLGGDVMTVEVGALAAVATRLEKESVRAKRRDLLAHSDVLQRVFADRTVLPFRFGVVFPSVDALVDELLVPRQDELLSLLDRFDGTGELRLRATYHDREAILAELVNEHPELARLRGRDDPASLYELGEATVNAYVARRQADADAVVARLRSHAVDVRIDSPTDEREVVRASFLVATHDTGAFERALEAAALAERHRIDFVCTGPVPPHSFVTLGGQ